MQITSIVGIAALALALVFLLAYFYQRHRLAPINFTVTSSVAQIQELAAAYAHFTSAKFFQQLVEVKGRVESATPLLAPLSERECVYYNMNVSWEYEEIEREEKLEGGPYEHKHEREETLAEEEQWQTFVVRDDTGAIRVDPQNCEVIPMQTLSRHEEDEGLPEEAVQCGLFTMPAPWKTSIEQRRPLRYRFEEQAILVGSEVYVLAEAANEDGDLRLRKPRHGDRFIISTKREEELLRSARLLLWGLLVSALVCSAAGIFLLLN